MEDETTDNPGDSQPPSTLITELSRFIENMGRRHEACTIEPAHPARQRMAAQVACNGSSVARRSLRKVTTRM